MDGGAEERNGEGATVHWIVDHQQYLAVRADCRSFASLAEAVRFVMEELPAERRPVSWITTETRSIGFYQIEAAYRHRGRQTQVA